MESRTRFAIGGASTVVASVAVVCAVALTNSIALADSRGVPTGANSVVVAARTAHVAATPTSTPAPVAETIPEPAPVAETVPGPAPIIVAEQQPVAPAAEQTADQAVAEAQAAGSWQPVRDWAARFGWSQDRVDAWIEQLELKRATVQEHVAGHHTRTEDPSEWSDLGWKDRSRYSPDRRDR